MDSFIPLSSRQAEWNHRVAMIRRARQFLYLSTYFYHCDQYGRELGKELIAAARRGVRVWLVIDRFGQGLARALMAREELRELKLLLETLRREGVHTTRYTPPRLLQRLFGSGYHIKVQVSEEGEAIYSTGNISATSFDRWNEYAVAFRGPMVRELLASLMAVIDRPERAHLDALDAAVRINEDGDLGIGPAQHSRGAATPPEDGNQSTLDAQRVFTAEDAEGAEDTRRQGSDPRRASASSAGRKRNSGPGDTPEQTQQRESGESCGSNPKTYYLAYNPCDDPSILSPFVQANGNPLTDALVRLIDRARHRLRITSFYFKPAPELFRALERAAMRGVAVEIHHSHRDALPESDAPWISTTFFYRRCLELGMAIHERRGGEHTKILVADGTEAAFGTYNLEHAAHDRLAESMIFTRDPAIVAELGRVVDEIRAHPANRRVDKDLLANLPLTLKAKRLLLYPLRRWI